MAKVMLFGTFDILHKGHEFFLNEAKKLGDFLVVAVARDDTVRKVKKQQPLNDEKMRLGNLQKPGIADKVILGYSGDKLRIIEDEQNEQNNKSQKKTQRI